MHLDLKSPNILLAADYSAKIADVGLSRIFTTQSMPVAMVSTPAICYLVTIKHFAMCSFYCDAWSVASVYSCCHAVSFTASMCSDSFKDA